MSDLKTSLRELSVGVGINVLKRERNINFAEVYRPKNFLNEVRSFVPEKDFSEKDLQNTKEFSCDEKQILKNGINLAEAIYKNQNFKINNNSKIKWIGKNNDRNNPIDLYIDRYGFSLKENSFILENMGLYKLLNCFTMSNYKKRHIFSDYARKEYVEWFKNTWQILCDYLNKHNEWKYIDKKKNKKSIIKSVDDNIFLIFSQGENKKIISELPKTCDLYTFEKKTNSTTREQVFSKFINKEKLGEYKNYYYSKKLCAQVAADNVVEELQKNINYNDGLARFLGIYENEYYYAKTSNEKCIIYRIPGKNAFGKEIIIESIKSSIPRDQSNIITTIRNTKTEKYLILRNECRFSHGQFNGTPEAKLYYDRNSSLEVIYEQL